MLAGVVDGVRGLSWRVGGDDGAGGGAHGGQFRLSGDDAFQDIRRALCVVRIEGPAIFGMDEFRMAAVVDGGGDGQAAGHGFGDDEAPVVLQRGDDETVGGAVERGDGAVIDGACEDGIDGVLLAEILQCGALWAVSGQENGGVKFCNIPGLKELPQSFEFHEPSDEKEYELVAEAVFLAEFAVGVFRDGFAGLGELFGIRGHLAGGYL